MARKTKDEAFKTREKILASALALFVKNGYDRTSFNEIAARVKMTKGAVYWHFESKEALLVALVERMLTHFQQLLHGISTKEELDFAEVSSLMCEIAEKTISVPKFRAYFLLMKTQIKWGDSSMTSTREFLLKQDMQCPYKVIVSAVEAGKNAGTIRADVDAVQTASICLAAWDGLVQAKIDGFFQYNLGETVGKAFSAVWESIKV